MEEFLRKFDNRGTKIARANSILNTKFCTVLFILVIYFNFVRCLGPNVIEGDFPSSVGKSLYLSDREHFVTWNQIHSHSQGTKHRSAAGFNSWLLIVSDFH